MNPCFYDEKITRPAETTTTTSSSARRRRTNTRRTASGSCETAAPGMQQHTMNEGCYKLPVRLMILIFLFRAYNAWILSTFYSPDEYWQSLEVAHELVFGYGAQLTWDWAMRIRGSVHVLLFSAVYWILLITGLDKTSLIVELNLNYN
jgi:hypothetical protein